MPFAHVLDTFPGPGKAPRHHSKQMPASKPSANPRERQVDHDILKSILEKYIEDKNLLHLLGNIIDGFSPGLPLGNLTSQLLVNIYMNEFDQFVKHKLREKFYIRYADDFVFFSRNKTELENLIPETANFLETNLKLTLHPHKVFIKTIYSGVDFLGWVHFPKYRVLRTSTKRKMFRKFSAELKEETRSSYVGMLSHGNTYKLKKALHLE
jgi:hypothetical protein